MHSFHNCQVYFFIIIFFLRSCIFVERCVYAVPSDLFFFAKRSSLFSSQSSPNGNFPHNISHISLCLADREFPCYVRLRCLVLCPDIVYMIWNQMYQNMPDLIAHNGIRKMSSLTICANVNIYIAFHRTKCIYPSIFIIVLTINFICRLLMANKWTISFIIAQIHRQTCQMTDDGWRGRLLLPTQPASTQQSMTTKQTKSDKQINSFILFFILSVRTPKANYPLTKCKHWTFCTRRIQHPAFCSALHCMNEDDFCVLPSAGIYFQAINTLSTHTLTHSHSYVCSYVRKEEYNHGNNNKASCQNIMTAQT